MFTRKSTQDDRLEDAIDNVCNEMKTVNTNSEDYAKMVDQLVKLYAIKETISPKRVSPDTLATIAGNLLGILVIVGHERTHVITSKALSFVMKSR